MIADGRKPCGPSEAIARALAYANVAMPYRLGSGDYRPHVVAGKLVDAPWTRDRVGVLGSDCWGLIRFAYKLRGHRPGYAPGRVPAPYRDQSDVDDDINSNSAIEDALTTRELFEIVPHGEPLRDGDVLTYATIRIMGADGELHTFIGHGQLVHAPRGVLAGGPYTPATVVQCFGGNDRKPAIMVTDAHAMDRHDQQWPKEGHRTQVLRVVP